MQLSLVCGFLVAAVFAYKRPCLEKGHLTCTRYYIPCSFLECCEYKPVLLEQLGEKLLISQGNIDKIQLLLDPNAILNNQGSNIINCGVASALNDILDGWTYLDTQIFVKNEAIALIDITYDAGSGNTAHFTATALKNACGSWVLSTIDYFVVLD